MRRPILLVFALLAVSFAGRTMAANEDLPTVADKDVVLLYVPSSIQETLDMAVLAADDAQFRADLNRIDREFDDANVDYSNKKRFAESLKESDPQVDSAQKAAKDALTAAREKYEARGKKAQEALDRYEIFFNLYPRNWYARHRLGWFLADLPDYGAAAEQWEKVIEMEPKFPYAHNNLGTLYNHVGRDLESILLYRQAIILYPCDAGFWENLALNYTTHRKETMEHFGWDLQKTWNECIGAYRTALKLEPQNADLAYELATQYVWARFFEVGDVSDDELDAWRYFLTLEITDMQRSIALRNMGRIHLRQKNDPETALEIFKSAKAFHPDDDSTLNVLIKQAEDALKAKE